jgi:hypothetical protein
MEHTMEVMLPSLAAGHFQGLFFENIEAEFTRTLVK